MRMFARLSRIVYADRREVIAEARQSLPASQRASPAVGNVKADTGDGEKPQQLIGVPR